MYILLVGRGAGLSVREVFGSAFTLGLPRWGGVGGCSRFGWLGEG